MGQPAGHFLINVFVPLLLRSPKKDAKKSPRKNKKEKTTPYSKESGSEMITETVGGFEPTSPLATIQKNHTTELQRSKIEIIPQKTRAEDQQTQGAPSILQYSEA